MVIDTVQRTAPPAQPPTQTRRGQGTHSQLSFSGFAVFPDVHDPNVNNLVQRLAGWDGYSRSQAEGRKVYTVMIGEKGMVNEEGLYAFEGPFSVLSVRPNMASSHVYEGIAGFGSHDGIHYAVAFPDLTMDKVKEKWRERLGVDKLSKLEEINVQLYSGMAMALFGQPTGGNGIIIPGMRTSQFPYAAVTSEEMKIVNSTSVFDLESGLLDNLARKVMGADPTGVAVDKVYKVIDAIYSRAMDISPQDYATFDKRLLPENLRNLQVLQLPK